MLFPANPYGIRFRVDGITNNAGTTPFIFTPTADCSINPVFDFTNVAIGTAIDFSMYFYIVDLTQLFGAGFEPTSVSDPLVRWIEEYVASHPGYNEGELVSFTPSAVVSRGKNIFDLTSVEQVRLCKLMSGSMRAGYMFYAETDCVIWRNKSLPAWDQNININVFHVDFDGNVLEESLGVLYSTRDPNLRPERNGIILTGGRMYAVAASNQDKSQFFSIVTSIEVMIDKGRSIKEYMPQFKRTTPLTSIIFKEKYFPNGMHSAGSVCDEFDLERGVAIKRTELKTIADFKEVSVYPAPNLPAGLTIYRIQVTGIKPINTQDYIVEGFNKVTAAVTNANMTNKTVRNYYSNVYNLEFVTDDVNLAAFKQRFGANKLCYRL